MRGINTIRMFIVIDLDTEVDHLHFDAPDAILCGQNDYVSTETLRRFLREPRLEVGLIGRAP
jgi:hypothetical protein